MIILENIKNLGKIEVQWQLFLADWKFFGIKILKFQKMIWNFDIICSKLSHNVSKVQHFGKKSSHCETFFPKLKHSLTKIVNLGSSVYTVHVDTYNIDA